MYSHAVVRPSSCFVASHVQIQKNKIRKTKKKIFLKNFSACPLFRARHSFLSCRILYFAAKCCTYAAAEYARIQSGIIYPMFGLGSLYHVTEKIAGSPFVDVGVAIIDSQSGRLTRAIVFFFDIIRI